MRKNRDPFDIKPGRFMVLGTLLGIVYYAALAGIILVALHIAGVI